MRFKSIFKVTAYAVSNLPMQEQLWIVDDTVAAVSLNFYCDFAFDVGAEAVLDFKAGKKKTST